ncbi:conserved hypothetical protein [Methanocaldococcus vulcanius M7]|uniref:Uncharacterized protein n=1 Tax=Methanocaldococcus vulcanius (strain ATCC 700851 / DSM 12094 / M7) TaxID=579137 RepID=C9REA9_METVM|nr:hypothetical protein [Methanocaldococcus vulcanius]ACX71911.1 conserved hypothetical protein [Methanocaldococcus vulcanius M7]
MEKLPYEITSTIFRKAILHYVLIRGTTYPQSLAKNLNISKGLACSFLRLCSALNVMKRERAGHKVIYSFTSKGLAVLKRLAPEIFDLSFSSVFEKLPKKKISTKHYPLTKIGFEIKWKEDKFGGIVFSFFDADGEHLGDVFRSNIGRWWCVICQSDSCKHIDYLKRLYKTLKNQD